MKKILIFVIAIAMSVAHAGAAVRDGGTTQRATQKRISTTPITERGTTNRTSILKPERNTVPRSANTDKSTARTKTTVIERNPSGTQNISARATTTQNQTLISETRTGAAYETCKSAFFTCMDQFCALKNDDYRRCSCSKRITDMEKQRGTLTDAGQQLTVFTENLDVVGLTAAQAAAMRTASEGENALSNDTSASKALLQAIMNSISGGDTTVNGKYSELNTINMSYDLTNVFGSDANQIVASYNGQDLYSAVYPQCRHAVAADCNTASLQRAVNAYLMAIEQDCNTVQTAIDEKRSQMKAAIREGSAMLDLARVENRRQHNSDDITTCINNVESAILSEEVCGANYHKCLDNGEFIDISTGAPIAGVVRFYELGNLLTFNPGVDAANQQLSKRATNRTFVLNFEKRTKKFAEPALDKCVEIADDVWSAYLDKAMLAIYYAQQSKVSEIKQGCFDFVSSCYADSDTSITAAMAELIGSGITLLQPDKIALTTQMCTDYVESCNNMFDGNIIEEYVNNRQDTDTLAACRAVVKQCFSKYGGTGYENFYYPYSGLFNENESARDGVVTPGDWFTLYDLTSSSTATKYLSPCANQLATVPACSDPNIIAEAFGGFDRMYTKKSSTNSEDQLSFDIVEASESGAEIRYGFVRGSQMTNRMLRPVGIATEIYNQIVDSLTTQCTNINGRFVERQFIKENIYGGKRTGQNKKNICLWYPQKSDSGIFDAYKKIAYMYGIFTQPTTANDEDGDGIPDKFNDEVFYGENMCPRDYDLNVDTSFWGACLCWENGARRSKNGKSATCVTEVPAKCNTNSPIDCSSGIKDRYCYSVNNNNTIQWRYDLSDSADTKFDFWCTQSVNSDKQVCPYNYTIITTEATETDTSSQTSIYVCADDAGTINQNYATDPFILKLLPEALK